MFCQNNKFKFYFLILFCTAPFLGFCQNTNQKTDSTILNNAALSMRYYHKFYNEPTNTPTNDSAYWERTIIILNDEKTLSKEEFYQLDKSNIISIKEVLNHDEKK